MPQIKRLDIYPLRNPVASKDYWIGTRAIDEKTVNFSAIQVADYVSSF
jgi:hypothetical protein